MSKAMLKLLSFFIRGKPVQRWYNFSIHRFVKKPEIMYRLSFALNYVPIHNKYKSFLFQVWSVDRDTLGREKEVYRHRFLEYVGDELESLVYAREEYAVYGESGLQEVAFDEKLDGEEWFEVEHH